MDSAAKPQNYWGSTVKHFAKNCVVMVRRKATLMNGAITTVYSNRIDYPSFRR